MLLAASQLTLPLVETTHLSVETAHLEVDQAADSQTILGLRYPAEAATALTPLLELPTAPELRLWWAVDSSG